MRHGVGRVGPGTQRTCPCHGQVWSSLGRPWKADGAGPLLGGSQPQRGCGSHPAKCGVPMASVFSCA